MAEHEPVVEEKTYCAVHPDRETTLRCNKCGRLMCVECAVPTPVGYRCRECVRAQEDRYYNAATNDYVIVFAICAVLTLIGGTIASAIGLGLLVIFLAIPLGGAIGTIASRAIQKRRGRYMKEVATAGVIIGGVLGNPVYIFLRTGVFILSPTLIGRDISLLLFVGATALIVYGAFKIQI